MRYYPLFFDLQNKHVIVIGGGPRALAKVRLMLKTDARVRLVAPLLHPDLAVLAAEGAIDWRQKRFAPEDLDGAALVYAATGLDDIDGQVAAAAKARQILVNAVDTPHLCDFLTPALVDRDPIVVAIGTEGASPVLAREIKAHLDGHLPEHLGAFARFASSLRNRVKLRLGDETQRRRFWDAFFRSPARHFFLAGEAARARDAAETLIEAHAEAADARAGFVWLVGAGPGDPELMTLKAQRVLQEADVIVVDRLVDERVLDYARRDAQRIYVGKAPGKPSIKQSEINAILIEQAQLGHNVVRLKGGDPFIFGRGGEEVAALEAAGIDCAVVPGITAASACAASARLPLTHREVTRSFSLLTGATASGVADHDWHALARAGQAFGVYMGVGAAGHIQHQLLVHGMEPATPVIIIENGTRDNERIIETRADALSAAVKSLDIRGPALIYVGLHWDQAGIARPAKVESFVHSGTIVALPQRTELDASHLHHVAQGGMQ